MYGPPWGMNRPAEDPRNPKPKTFSEWPRFLFRALVLLCKRMFYVLGLVWEARPWILFVMTFMAVFDGFQAVASTYISKLLLDKLALAFMGQLEGGFASLAWLLALQLGFRLLVRVLGALNHIVTRLSNEVLAYSIRLKIMNKSKTVDLSSFDLPEFYSKLENANREAGNRPLSILQSTFTVFSTAISMITFITLLGTVVPWAPPLILAMAIPSALIHYHYRTKMFNYVRRRSRDRREMNYYANLVTDKYMVKEIKLFNLGDFLIDKYKTIFKKYYHGVRDIIVKEGIWGIILAALQACANAAVFLTISKKVFDRILTVGDYSLYTNALTHISNGVATIVNTTAGIYEGTLFIDNMIDYMNQEQTVVPSLPEPRAVARHTAHTIVFDHVSFAYPGTDRKVLDDICMTIREGETIILVGLNGAGKTTLLKLLTRLYDPTEGTITLDGKDIREYDVRQLYDIFGVIFQDFGKYAFTVGENIALGQIDNMNDGEKIRECAEKSASAEFIERLALGYDTPLTRQFEDTGTELSIGQWQKISVARAFFRDSDIMILDEPTASLDPMAEQAIFDQFDRLRGNKTTIFVSHRLSSATVASRILVLENGRLIESGSHKELMEQNGRYAELFNTQASRYLDPENGHPEERRERHHQRGPKHEFD